MKRKIHIIFSFLIVLSLLWLPGSALAQDEQPPDWPVPQGMEPPGGEGWLPDPPSGAPPVEGAQQSEEGLWYVPDGAQIEPELEVGAQASASATDKYGYKRTVTTFSWIDATGGTNLNMAGKYAVMVDLPFAFKFYENTYTSVEVNHYGYLTFKDAGWWDPQSPIPDPYHPNDVIAPYWAPLDRYYGGVYQLEGGTAPNRYVVIEFQAKDEKFPNYFTFEVILYENGNIVFQYDRMDYGWQWYCGAAGIEDSAGLDGINSLRFCRRQASYRAVRFTRPRPMARVKVDYAYAYNGAFAAPGGTADMVVDIRNTGELGPDVFDLKISSRWPATLYAADGITPLTDTNGNTWVDTGPLDQDARTQVVVKIQAPLNARVGKVNKARLTVRSALDRSKKKTADLQAAIPSAFAQIYRAGDNPAILALIQPGGRSDVQVGSLKQYDLAVSEAPNGNLVTAWVKDECYAVCVSESYYALYDHNGVVLKGETKLVDNSGATVKTYDLEPAVAITPDGSIGLAWKHVVYDEEGLFNQNIYFAILDGSGDLVFGPVRVTWNPLFGDWSTNGVPRFYSPRLAATDDNRFFLVWEEFVRVSSSKTMHNIFRASYGSDGSVVSVRAQLAGESNRWYYPNTALTSLDGGRVLVAWSQNNGIAYLPFSSGGEPLSGAKVIVGWGWGPDVVQLSGGNILLAWTDYTWAGFSYRYRIAYTLISDITYKRTRGISYLKHPGAYHRGMDVSVTRDAAGNGILTWTDYLDYHLYYSLVDGKGRLVTAPIIFETGEDLFTSYEGYGNTTYTMP